MEDQDIFNQFKKAANNAESPGFQAMDKVWQRVEEKLDKKELKNQTVLWKKWAVAASLLLGCSIGYQFLKDPQPVIRANEVVIAPDSTETIAPASAVVTATQNPQIKEDAKIILEQQLVASEPVAIAADAVKAEEVSTDDSPGSIGSTPLNPVPAATQGYFTAAKSAAQNENAKDIELFMGKENKVSAARKEKPLIVYDNLATNKKSVKEVEMDEIESIIELPDPLYIINGVEFTEQELFGPNPTSPYAPLNDQEIDSISILQDEKAISAYGQKGKKGVVIISTKNGKPAAKKQH